MRIEYTGVFLADSFFELVAEDLNILDYRFDGGDETNLFVIDLIKRNIRPMVKMRFMPELEFIYDETARKAERMERLMQQVHKDDDTDDENSAPE